MFIYMFLFLLSPSLKMHALERRATMVLVSTKVHPIDANVIEDMKVQHVIDKSIPCLNFVCYNEGNCIVQQDNQPVCQCAQGFRGPNCYESDGMWVSEHARVCLCESDIEFVRTKRMRERERERRGMLSSK